ncbi:MAG: BrnA antitoxin family protein [Pseudomonadota bacterium]
MTSDIQKKKRALIDFLENGEALRSEASIESIRKRLPPEWDQIDLFPNKAPKKKKVTLRIDEDVWEIFRSMGPGHTSRINQVLRTYAMGRVGNALFARENALTPEELITGERNMSLKELERWVKGRG